MQAAQLTFVETEEAWSSKYWDLSTSTIRGLSLTRPCPFAFSEGGKLIENRPWKPPTKMIGRFIALHASKEWSDIYHRWITEQMGAKVPDDASSPDSIIFGVCRLIGYATNIQDQRINSQQRKWFLGPYAWLLDSFVALSNPVSCTGGQKLWGLYSRPESFAVLTSSYQEALKKSDRSRRTAD